MKRRRKKPGKRTWFAIYKLTNISTNESYIGITRIYKSLEISLQKRFDAHIKRAEKYEDTLICKNIRQFGKECFKIGFICKIQGKENALCREKELVASGEHVLNIIHRSARRITYKTFLKRLKLSTKHPGILFKEEYLPNMAISADQLAIYLQIPLQNLEEFLNGESLLSVSSYIYLSKLTSKPLGFWVKMSNDYLTSTFLPLINIDHYKLLTSCIK